MGPLWQAMAGSANVNGRFEGERGLPRRSVGRFRDAQRIRVTPQALFDAGRFKVAIRLQSAPPERRGTSSLSSMPPLTFADLAMDRFAATDHRQPHEHLAELAIEDHADRPFVFVNMVASVDGRATIEGRAHQLGSPTDTLLLTELRTLADAVLIGSGTLRAESYARLVANPDRVARREAAGKPPTPTAVLISRSLDLPWDAGLFQAADQPVVVYTAADLDPPPTPAPVEVVRTAEPPEALRDLKRRGVRALLCEGGPTLNRALLAAGLVDELFLTLSPMLVGNQDAPRIVEGEDLRTPVHLDLGWVLHHDGELYLRYRIRPHG
jgi:riboflavin-specific deaminase-like protein